MIKKAVIVGGGTSGWMTAACLKHKIPSLEVVLVDKEVSTPVSVGEATLLNFNEFMEISCGFPRHEWVRELDAVPKAGILFPAWGGEDIWHPFTFPYADEDTPLIDAWSRSIKKLRYLLPHDPLVDGHTVDMHDIQSYAYHIDCAKLVTYIQSKLGDRVETINKEVLFAKRDSSNNITQLMFNDYSDIDGDVFFDCTGFKQVLKNDSDPIKLLGRLFCDTAIAGHVDYVDDLHEKTPYVSCPTTEHGWIWKIPLQSRIGTGLVFNRSITDIETAKEYFKNYWNGRVKEDSIKVIDWTPYYDKKMWSANVISIGLSAGFIEPLESTGIAMITEAITKSVSIISGRYFNEHDANLFNSYMVSMFEDSVDFVSMHYDNSIIESEFWKFVRNTYQQSERQKIYIDNMKSTDRSLVEGKPSMFGGSNWIYWMAQLGLSFNEKTYITREYANDLVNNYLTFKDSLPKDNLRPSEFI